MAVRRARKTDGENILEYQYVLCEVKAVGVRANTAKYWKQWNDYKKSSACKFERGKMHKYALSQKRWIIAPFLLSKLIIWPV